MLILETQKTTICLHSLNQAAETKGQLTYTKGPEIQVVLEKAGELIVTQK